MSEIERLTDDTLKALFEQVETAELNTEEQKTETLRALDRIHAEVDIRCIEAAMGHRSRRKVHSRRFLTAVHTLEARLDCWLRSKNYVYRIANKNSSWFD